MRPITQYACLRQAKKSACEPLPTAATRAGGKRPSARRQWPRRPVLLGKQLISLHIYASRPAAETRAHAAVRSYIAQVTWPGQWLADQRIRAPAGQGRAPSGQREPRRSRGAIWAAITRQGIVWPRGSSPSRGVAPTTTPNQRPRISQPSMRTSTPVSSSRHSCHRSSLMHDPSHGSQVRSCSREPPRGDQYLGRGQDAHHDSMGTCGAR